MTEKEVLSNFGKNIRATLDGGKIIEGKLCSYTMAADSEEGETSIDIRPTFTKKGLICLRISEIKSIEIISE